MLGGLAGSLAVLTAGPGLAGTAFADATSPDATAPGAAQSGAAPSSAAQSGLGLPALPALPPVQGLPTAGVLGPDPAASVVGGALSSSSLLDSDSATTPDDPTPAPEGARYGAKPDTVIGGVPVEGTLNSVEGANAIIPGSGPKDYA
ncbi:hypothetical protein [Actinomycetospora sp.]|uniref:hypothetical protein n=1 Tax=Actinomycetospora sp. TaxID=1872135 RepID=UPI002F418AB8